MECYARLGVIARTVTLLLNDNYKQQVDLNMQNEDVIKHCTLKFRCPLKWQVLELTNQAGVRYCGECCKNVYYCQTKVELDKALSEGKCVALKVEVEELDFDDELMGF